MELIILVGLISFVASLFYHHKHPPTNEQRFRAKENRRKAAVFIGTTAASTGYHLVKGKKKKSKF